MRVGPKNFIDCSQFSFTLTGSTPTLHGVWISLLYVLPRWSWKKTRQEKMQTKYKEPRRHNTHKLLTGFHWQWGSPLKRLTCSPNIYTVPVLSVIKKSVFLCRSFTCVIMSHGSGNPNYYITDLELFCWWIGGHFGDWRDQLHLN